MSAVINNDEEEEISLECDYLIVGAGAGGMAFADVILSDSTHTVILVDRNAAPGGHWVHAYQFVRLHQPASYYGVASEPLAPPGDPNYRHTGAEIVAYYARVLAKFVGGGRARFYGGCEYRGDGTFRSLDGAGRAAHTVCICARRS